MAGPSPSPHKPRRKAKKPGNEYDVVIPRTEALVRSPAFPLSGFLWPARGFTSQWELLPLILMFAGIFRWAAGLWGYSGRLSVVFAKAAYGTDVGWHDQVSADHQCLETSKLRDTGWRSRYNCLSHSGTSTIYHGGDLTIHR